VTETVILFEITLAEKHVIKSYRVAELLKGLLATFKSVLIVCVIPENLIRNYSRMESEHESNMLD